MTRMDFRPALDEALGLEWGKLPKDSRCGGIDE